MELEQFIFLKSKTSDHDKLTQQDTEMFLTKMDYKNIPFDGKIFFIQSGGTEEIFKSIYQKYKEPFYLLATDANNSLPAVLEIISYLKKNNLSYYVFHGKPEDIKNQIINIRKPIQFNYQLKQNLHILQGLSLGVIGKPSDWLIASNVDYKNVYDIFGAKLIDIPFEEFKNEIKFDEDINIGKYSSYINDKISENEIKKALAIYYALKKLIKKYNLSGITVRCFDLLSSVHSTSCLALALLNDEGIVSACEGDIPSLITMMITKRMFKKYSFQCNPSFVDFKNNIVYLAHCTIPLKMCESFRFDTHFESGLGVAIKGKLRTKPHVCILKFDSSFKYFSLYSGHIEENMNKNNLCRTQLKIRLYEPVEEILSSPCGNHLIVFYSENKEEILKSLAIL